MGGHIKTGSPCNLHWSNDSNKTCKIQLNDSLFFQLVTNISVTVKPHHDKCWGMCLSFLSDVPMFYYMENTPCVDTYRPIAKITTTTTINYIWCEHTTWFCCTTHHYRPSNFIPLSPTRIWLIIQSSLCWVMMTSFPAKPITNSLEICPFLVSLLKSPHTSHYMV